PNPSAPPAVIFFPALALAPATARPNRGATHRTGNPSSSNPNSPPFALRLIVSVRARSLLDQRPRAQIERCSLVIFIAGSLPSSSWVGSPTGYASFAA
uniref:Uncharacterized protein n=1 Tax=Aegilops tauschii subsp. strangulata TaxID=200361 RepID=A0A453IEL2_AEGTS